MTPLAALKFSSVRGRLKCIANMEISCFFVICCIPAGVYTYVYRFIYICEYALGSYGRIEGIYTLSSILRVSLCLCGRICVRTCVQ